MRLKHLTRAAVITSAIAAPLAMALPAAQAAPSPSSSPSSSAFALSATGPVSVPQTPAVSYAGQGTVSKNGVEVPSNPLVQAQVLHAAAGKGHAKSSVVNLKVPQAHLTASLVAAKCVKGKATSHLVNVMLNGKKIQASAQPNSAVSVKVGALGTASLVLNKQAPAAGGGVNVTAIELTVPLGAGKTETIKIASATCAPGGDTGAPGDSDPSPSTPPSTPPAGEAPAPTPVPGDLPVTG